MLCTKEFFNTNVLCKKFFNSAILGSAQCPPGGVLPGTDGHPAPGPHRDQRPADGAGPGGADVITVSSLRSLRQTAWPGEFPVHGPVQDQRLRTVLRWEFPALRSPARGQDQALRVFPELSCTSCLVRLRSRAFSYRWGSFAAASTLEMFSSVRTVCSAVRTSSTSVRRACSRGVGHWLWHA